ncbi:putative zinc finger, CCHC-type containing protein [Tanacetum coccineum]
MGALATLQEGNKCLEEIKAKVNVYLHQHIDGMLEFEYLNCDDPSILWKDLQRRFDHQRNVLLPSAGDEWNNLRFQDFKKVAFGFLETIYILDLDNQPFTVKCGNCKKVGHMTQDCRNPAAAKNQRTITCFICGNQGHYRSDCSELKNQNQGSQAEGTEARGMMYVLGGGEIDQDIDDMEDDINA